MKASPVDHGGAAEAQSWRPGEAANPHTITSLIGEVAGRGARPCIIHLTARGSDIWTCEQLAREVSAIARGLVAGGLRPGETAALIGPNTPEWILTALALWTAGATIVPIDDVSEDTTITTAVIRASHCRWVFASRTHAAAMAEPIANMGARLVVLDAEQETKPQGSEPLRAFLAPDRHDASLPDLTPDAPAAYFATSGTTGPSKMFALSHRNMMVNVRALAAMGIVGARDRALLPLPLHHAYPIVVGVLTALAAGTAIVLPHAVTGAEIARALREAEATVVIGVPRLYEALLAGIEGRAAKAGRMARKAFAALLDVSVWLLRTTGLPAGRWLLWPVRRSLGPRLRLLVSGGAHLEAETMWQLEALGWMALSGYGLAETGSVFTCNRPDARRPGSAGRAFGDGKIRIAHPDEHGIGEIELKGSSITSGYIDNPEANRAAFTDDGWFRTGDLGALDANGYLAITGRSKEIMVLGGGKKVNPEELERRYETDSRIREIAVFQHQGALVGLVVPDIPKIRAMGVTRVRDAVRVAIAETARHLPSFQRLAGFAIANTPLPRTRLGKYRRFLLPDLYAHALAGTAPGPAPALSEADRALLAEPAAARAWATLGRRFEGRIAGLDASLDLDLGMDSFDWMALTLELEQATGARLAPEDLASVETVRDLMRAVSDAARRRAEGGLAAEPIGLAPDRWIQPIGGVLRALGFALHVLNRTVIRLAFPLRVEGQERLPRGRAFVITPNHASDLDPLVLAAALPWRLVARTYWAADAPRLFRSAASRLFCRAVHLFPVDERRPDAAVDSAARVLARGDVAVWFPEAWRSPDGTLQRFLPGIGVLLRRSGAVSVPTLITGTFEAMPRERRWPRRHALTICFGAPVEVGTLAAEGTGASAEARIADGLRGRVAALGRPVSPHAD